MSIYAELGVRRVINAAATLTKLGGSLMPAAAAALWEQDPRIAVSNVRGDSDAFALNPQTLEPGEDLTVLHAVRTLLESPPPHG